MREARKFRVDSTLTRLRKRGFSSEAPLSGVQDAEPARKQRKRFEVLQRRQPLCHEIFAPGVVPGIFHLNSMTYRQQLGSQTARFETGGRKYRVEIFVIFEPKSMSFPARAERARAPVFHRHNHHRRPESAFSDGFFGDGCLRYQVAYQRSLVTQVLLSQGAAFSRQPQAAGRKENATIPIETR